MDVAILNGQIDLSRYHEALRNGVGEGTSKVPAGQAMTHTIAIRDHVISELATAAGLTRAVEYLDTRIDNLGNRIDALERNLDSRFGDFKDAMRTMIDLRFSEAKRETDKQFADVDKRFNELEKKLDSVEGRITLRLSLVIGGIVGAIEIAMKFT